MLSLLRKEAPWLFAVTLHDQMYARQHVMTSKKQVVTVQYSERQAIHRSWEIGTRARVAAGLLITNPDLLLSGTLISNSFKCPRASVIQERFGGSGGYHAVKGTLLHEMFQVGCALLSLSVLHSRHCIQTHSALVAIFAWNVVLQESTGTNIFLST